MKQLFKAFSLISLIIYSLSGYSQHLTSSPYSRFGLGDLSLRTFGQGISMGGTSIALRTNFHINPANSASLTAIPMQTFIFEVGLNGKFTSLESAKSSDNSNAVNIGYLSFAFPITKWMGMSIGFMPYSSIGYKIMNNQILYKSATDKTEMAQINTQLEGSGGLTQYFISTGVKPFTGLSIGASLYALMGNTEHKSISNVTQDSTVVSILESTSTLKVKDINYNFGIQYEFKIKNKSICIGAVLDNKKDLSSIATIYKSIAVSGFNTNVIENDTISKDDSSKSGYGVLSIPSNLGFGISIANDKFLFAADYYEQDWTKTNFFGKTDNNLQVNKRYSAGVEYTPDYLSARYWKFVKYKFGAYQTQSYVQIPTANNTMNSINEIGFSVGLDLPILNKSFTLICPSIQFGSRGTTDNMLVREKFIICHLNFTMNDRWFMKRKID